jgi:hypothetical protein
MDRKLHFPKYYASNGNVQEIVSFSPSFLITLKWAIEYNCNVYNFRTSELIWENIWTK